MVADRREGLTDTVAELAGQEANRNWLVEVAAAPSQERAGRLVDNLLAVSPNKPVVGYRVKAEPKAVDKASGLPDFAEGEAEEQKLFYLIEQIGRLRHLAACLPDRLTRPV